MKLNGLTKTKKKKIIGIDYSLTSPAICVMDGDKLNFYYLTSKKKYDGKMSDNIEGQLHDEWDNPMHRFGLISDWVNEIPGVQRIIISEDKKIKGKKCYRIGINNGERWKEPLKRYHNIDMADCFQYYNPTILDFIASRI